MLGGVTVTKVAPEILAKYAGTYELTPGHDAVISIEADLLFLREGANPLKLPLVANSETVFVRAQMATGLILRNAQGGVTGFTYHGGGNNTRAFHLLTK